jgi:Pretoxin HINT domain
MTQIIVRSSSQFGQSVVCEQRSARTATYAANKGIVGSLSELEDVCQAVLKYHEALTACKDHSTPAAKVLTKRLSELRKQNTELEQRLKSVIKVVTQIQEYQATACFDAGTQLWTPVGYRNIEEIRPGDLIFSRSEHNPSGLIEAKVVEEVFERFAPVLNLHVGGQVIATTAEHPFFAYNKGWVAANTLEVGDFILAENGDWKRVEDLFDTGDWQPVYNLRVADWHTYFVGGDSWGWAAWAHNAYFNVKVSPTGLVQIYEGNQTTELAKAKSVKSLERAAYYLANLQSDEAGFNRVLEDIRAAIGRSTNAAVRAVTIRRSASENRNILVRGTQAWMDAAYAIGHTASGHRNDFRVASASDAQQLLWDAYDATTYGRLPLRRPGTDEWQAGRYEYGYHYDTDYEGDPGKNAYSNNLQHIKWTDNRNEGGHSPADGHIYYGTWNGPHQYTQPPQGW